MLITRSSLVLMTIILALALQGCTATSPQRMLDQQDHAGLANYYSQQAQDFREKAERWDFMAEFYETHPPPHGKVDVPQHARHCREIAQSYRKAADEAEALAMEHRRLRPHGVVN
ncbi:hypothetical protein [Candidatus Nitrospira bockiana]